MNLVILVAGIAGLAIAAYGFGTLVVDAVRHRQVLDILLAVAVIAGVVYLLLTFGDRLLR